VFPQPGSLGHHPPVELFPIGYVVTGYTRPGDTPPQAAENFQERGHLVVYEQYSDGLLGLENHPHIWLLTWLHSQREEQTTRLHVVPRGMEQTGQLRGVFATRSPNRHNRLGLSLVRVVEIVGNIINFHGVDLVSGTPVLDIKPWSTGIDIPPHEFDPPDLD
jgi:tRNA-Thr(GGU) m(6)t(6)A37 methyltransferase TsaA